MYCSLEFLSADRAQDHGLARQVSTMGKGYQEFRHDSTNLAILELQLKKRYNAAVARLAKLGSLISRFSSPDSESMEEHSPVWPCKCVVTY